MGGTDVLDGDDPKLTRAERSERGRDVRHRLPRSSWGEWSPGPHRDPDRVLTDQERTRVPELVPVRHERMAASPFAFYRGAAAVFAADLATGDHSGLMVQLCGDAHLANFGAFASPERTAVFDINDFDETLPGPFEWDLARLAASFEVATRTNRFDDAQRATAQQTLIRTYCSSMGELAQAGFLDVWYAHLSLVELKTRFGSQASVDATAHFARSVRKARRKDNLRAFDRLTDAVDGQLRFRSDPPLLERAEDVLTTVAHDQLLSIVSEGLDTYRQSLPPDRRLLMGRYRFVDQARKVVGVGSVGTRCWVALLVGLDDADPLFLQVKEAEASVLEPHLAPSRWAQNGQRVVEGQRLMQSASDIFLGWDRLPGVDGGTHDYYFRQLWDWKGSADIDALSPEGMGPYAQMCGHTLARAHARTGDPVTISACVGGGGAMARSMGRFASTYADQNERDHTRFTGERIG